MWSIFRQTMNDDFQPGVAFQGCKYKLPCHNHRAKVASVSNVVRNLSSRWGVLVLFLYVILELYQYQYYSKQKLTWFPEFVLHLCPEIICIASMHVFFIQAH